MNQIQKYEPQLEVITKDGEIYFTPLENKSVILQKLNSDKFIEINGEIISCYSVVKVREAKNKSGLENFSPEIRRLVKQRSQVWSANLNKQPPLEKQIEWAVKLEKGEQI